MKFSITDFFSKYDQIRSFLVTFTEEISNGKLHFLCSVSYIPFTNVNFAIESFVTYEKVLMMMLHMKSTSKISVSFY